MSVAAGSGTSEDGGGSKDVVLKIFGQELGEKMALAAGYGKRKDYRGVLEPTDPVTQCERSGHPFEPNMPCYICGQPIPDKSVLSGPEDELYVECEHVLPVTEARWFLDLYMTNRPPKDEWTKKAVALEYEQSHRVCNQAKSNFSFIKVDDSSGNPILDKNGIRKVLSNIQARARKNISKYDTDPNLKKIMQTIASTVQYRGEEIADRVQAIVNHVESGRASEPEYQNMILLLRTATLVDPSTLPNAVRQIHSEWYQNVPAAEEEKKKRFFAFIENTYNTYPELRPERLISLLLEGLFDGPPPKEILDSVSKETVETILQSYFDIQTEPDVSGKTLLSTVYYGVYRALLPRAVELGVVPIICRLMTRMSIVISNEPKVKTIIGDIPIIDADLQQQCKNLSLQEDRMYRAEARELNTELEDIEDIPTAEEDAMYFLSDLQPRLQARLERDGYTSDQATAIATSVVEQAREAFIQAYPEGIDRALEESAENAESVLRLGFGKDIAYADSIATSVFKFLLNSKSEETRTYGGSLHTRRPLYSNARKTAAQHVARTSNNEGLRERVGTRTRRRLRKSSRSTRRR